MKERITKAVNGAIKEIDVYRDQAPERAAELERQLKVIESKAFELLEDSLGASYYAETGQPEELLNYLVLGVKFEPAIDIKRLVALIKRNL